MRILLAITLCAFAAGAGAQLYQWTDSKGRVHVSDTPPPTSVKGLKQITPAGPTAPATPQTGTEPFAVQQAKAKYPVTLYTIPNCQGCDLARTLLNTRGVPFKETSLTDASQLDEFKKLVGGNTVPAMVVGSTVQKGFEESAYQGLLDAAGYPTTGTVPPRNQQQPTAAAPSAPEVKPVATEPEKQSGPYAPSDSTEPPTKKKK